MQRISCPTVLQSLLLSAALLCTLTSAASEESPQPTFLQQQEYQTLSGDVVIADMDDFADWLYTNNGGDYNSGDDFRLYRVTEDSTRGRDLVLDEDDTPTFRTYSSFLDISNAQNPLGRDTDELPDDPNDIGRDHRKGDLTWVLVTSFLPDEAGTGKVWAVPNDRDDRDNAYVLVGGLQTPTGVCFDPNHSFLYVCDPAQSSIFQYEIDWDDEDKFVLSNDVVATIMQGVTAMDCSVDAFGNLYFVDFVSNAISIVGYLDLWAGYVGQSRILYQADGDDPMISGPVGVDVYNSETIYFVNNINSGTAGLLNSAPTGSAEINSGDMETAVREDRTAWGLAVSDRFAYFSSNDGSVRTM